jgi:hypothetical protein
MSERKFNPGDKVKVNHRELAVLTGTAKKPIHNYRQFEYVPNPESLKLIIRRRARRIASIRYDDKMQCSFYKLATNHRGKSDILSTIEFRSYQLMPITEPNKIGRPKKVKRNYTRRQNAG